MVVRDSEINETEIAKLLGMDNIVENNIFDGNSLRVRVIMKLNRDNTLGAGSTYPIAVSFANKPIL